MALSWARQFNEKLISISNLLHRNFQDDHHIYPPNNQSSDYNEANVNDEDDDDDDINYVYDYNDGNNVNRSLTDAVTVDNLNSSATGKICNRNTKRRKRFLRSRSNSSADPKELDMLVLKPVEWDDSDDDY